jgi:myosin heavy subunit
VQPQQVRVIRNLETRAMKTNHTHIFLFSAAYLLNGWLRIPQLKEQVKRLEVQVNLLNIEVNRLGAENDRYEALNDDLNNTVYQLTNLTESLNATVVELEDVTNSLNETNQELSQQVENLTTQNENYAQLNENLNSTALYFSAEVDVLKDTISQLILENDALANLTGALESIKDRLSDITVEQNETLIELRSTLESFTAENDRLQDLNSDLLTIVGFLNETSVGIDDSLSEITGFLSSQIAANGALVIESLENTYRQRVATWDCDYRDVFREQAFGSDFNAPITERETVLSYVDDRVLSELCLDRDDFDRYLSSTFPEGLTSYRLARAVVEYTSEALDYYFPEENEVGLSRTEWSDASYACKNIESTFRWN